MPDSFFPFLLRNEGFLDFLASERRNLAKVDE